MTRNQEFHIEQAFCDSDDLIRHANKIRLSSDPNLSLPQATMRKVNLKLHMSPTSAVFLDFFRSQHDVAPISYSSSITSISRRPQRPWTSHLTFISPNDTPRSCRQSTSSHALHVARPCERDNGFFGSFSLYRRGQLKPESRAGIALHLSAFLHHVWQLPSDLFSLS